MSAKADETAGMLREIKVNDKVALRRSDVEAWMAKHGEYLRLDAEDLDACWGVGVVQRFGAHPVEGSDAEERACYVSWAPYRAWWVRLADLRHADER